MVLQFLIDPNGPLLECFVLSILFSALAYTVHNIQPLFKPNSGHLMMRGGMMNFPLSPHHQRFSSPQFPNRRFQDPRQNYQRQHYDGRMSNDNHSPRQQDRGEHHHQFTDLEKKIHSILTAAESGPNRFDPYAGIMSRREKEWLIKIQLLQLTSNEPELDDYYFQVRYVSCFKLNLSASAEPNYCRFGASVTSSYQTIKVLRTFVV